MKPSSSLRLCLRDPIPELFNAARFLDAAVSAHLAGKRTLADALIRKADIPAIRDWSESLWGPGGPFSRPLPVENQPPILDKSQRARPSSPSQATRRSLLARDGFVCRFCEIPLVRGQTRELIRTAYPDALRWGGGNAEQHAAFQAMDLHFDHVVPHARGGASDVFNMVVTCAPCNCGRAQLTLAQVGLSDPRSREPVRSKWDGLERFRPQSAQAAEVPPSQLTTKPC